MLCRVVIAAQNCVVSTRYSQQQELSPDYFVLGKSVLTRFTNGRPVAECEQAGDCLIECKFYRCGQGPPKDMLGDPWVL